MTEEILRVPMYFPEREVPAECRRVRLFDLICCGGHRFLEFKQGKERVRVDWDYFFRELYEKDRMARRIMAL